MDSINFILIGVILVLIIFIVFKEKKLNLRKDKITNSLDRVLEGNFNERILISEKDRDEELIYKINDLIEELQHVDIEKRRTEKRRKELLSNISHDIRTPLTSIIGYIDALRDNKVHREEDKELYLEILRQKSNSLKLLIDDIFHISKLDANEVEIKKEKIDINEILRTTILGFIPLLEKYNIEPYINISNNSYYIFADENSIVRILNNIINNALQHGKSGKVIGLEVYEEFEYFKVQIWDRGEGIPQEIINRIFDRLFKLDDSRNKSPNNNGLGLAITKKLIEKNDGYIEVYSKPNEKTSFIIYLPKYKGSQL